MEREDILHLASLARIRVTDKELERLTEELPAIVSYVGQIAEITAGNTDTEPTVGPLHNVFRADEVTNQDNEFTDDILREMPETDGRYMKVRKILKTDVE